MLCSPCLGALKGSGLPGGPGVHKAKAASPLALSLGKQEYIEFICHSQEFLPAPEQMPHTHTPTPYTLVNAPAAFPASEAHGELEPMSYLVLVGIKQQSSAQKSLGFSMGRCWVLQGPDSVENTSLVGPPEPLLLLVPGLSVRCTWLGVL